MEKKIWRIFFMVYANKTGDDETTERLEKFKQSLSQAKLSPSNSYILLLNEIDDRKSENKEDKVRDKSCFFEIIEKNDHIHFKKILTVYTPKLFYKISKITKKLKAIFEKIPAQRTFVITWDHGAFFGIFKKPLFSVSIINKLMKELQFGDFLPTEQFNRISEVTNSQNLQCYYRWWDNSLTKFDILKSRKNPNANLYYSAQGERVFKVSDKISEEQIMELIKITLSETGKDLFATQLKEIAASFLTENELTINISATEYRNNLSKEFLAYVDKSRHDMLSNEALGKILSNVFGKVDILLMMNCYMQNLHTNYALKDVVSVLIAAQGDMEFPGYDFKRILDKLAISPLISEESLVKFIIKTTSDISKKSSTIVEPFKIGDLLSLFASKPVEIEKIIYLIDDITRYFLSKIQEDDQVWRHIISEARNKCFAFETIGPRYYSIDIFCWLFEIIKVGVTCKQDIAQINAFISELSAINSHYIMGSHRGPAYTEYANPLNSGTTKIQIKINNVLPLACSIYFPPENIVIIDPLFVTADKTSLFKNCLWPSFLKKLII